MRSLIASALRNKRVAALWAVVIVTVLTVAFVASAQATNQASFCTTCHEMTPYYEAWQDGPHGEVSCIECHVDAGTAARLAHKVTALGEVYAHFTDEPRFPMNATEVPDARCLACHEGTIASDLPDFDHDTHRAGKPCISCHADVGHDVTASALAEAGVLDPDAQAAREAARVAEVGAGDANVPAHKPVTCSNCHDMAATGCVSCHEPGHEPRDVSTTCTDCHSANAAWAFEHPERTDCATCHETPEEHYTPTCDTCHTAGDFEFGHPGGEADCTTCHETPAGHRDGACTSCHDPGPEWAFEHPAATSDCVSCHTRPAKHYAGSCSACHTPGTTFARSAFKHPGASANCATCHTKPARHYAGTCNSCHKPGTPFAKAVFTHPGASATCTNCHNRPSGHAGGACTTCHQPASSWKFTHPKSTDCASCHRAPGSHYAGTCATCHTVGKPFSSAVFTHPGASATCTNCHNRPSGHASGTCTTCHQPASSWKFTHPKSTDCASCHRAPSNHYGTTCVSCHTVGQSWGSATFSHARITGGEHTYRSFSCATCHPSGYGSYSCLQCHSDNNGGDDDDDDDD
ncbi:MAG: NapC/NirT family cytochrome c [Coriobacteriia bacterium]|nr:NapC/NirT family cytochrome c [Coriobacteriia bacterium]